ncbi:helix-turn-helix domain-containing protein [Metabacillus endolithicus]|uniref:Helix-turn-helix domain-containing protein n=1 Tax=Metabacillus endolithicus TaxID=1535204 RepID=A0ABW5BY60_9BACI|nr:helix-turn-helix transcriptional regulator [Metabacillus endolithicus]UPG65886.1 helix-turn-helix transcriptional regulator [Metabacillus endolithicus]
MNPSNYEKISDFLSDFMEEINISSSDFSKRLDVSPQYISQIMHDKKIPSEKILIKLSDIYHVQLNDLMQLRQKTKDILNHGNPTLPVDQTKGNEKTEESNEDNVSETNTLFSNQGMDTVHPEIKAVIEKLSSLSDDIQVKISDDISELINSHILNLIQKYSYRDVKEVLRKTYDNWKRIINSPGYEKEESVHFQEELEGYLELSTESLFFTLSSNEHFLYVTTRYQDRQLMDDLIKIVPGIKVTEYTNGNLGKTYKNAALFRVFIFNPATMVKEMKPLLSDHNLNINKITFEECHIEPFFKA